MPESRRVEFLMGVTILIRRNIFVALIVLAVSVAIFSGVDAKSEAQWRLDGTSSADLPRNFRMIDDLRAAAGAQPSQAALQTIYDKLHAANPNAKIFIIDLRQETHGYVNSLPVSLHVKHNAINAGKSVAEIEREESKCLKDLRGVETTFKPMGNADTKILKPVTIVPRFIETERVAAEKIGFEYVRFAAADMQFPAPEVVDDIISFIANLPADAMMYVHCHAGHGRTTTFLVMCELMRNPDASLEEICQRQKDLGGSDILEEPDGKDWNARMARDRAQKIRLFQEFVRGTRAEQIGLTWSEWLKEKDR